uniref:Uncharacterized protein n=1 Tax=Amblyomma triste TaxID=251400 RepID=A0A023GC72_AMBTT
MQRVRHKAVKALGGSSWSDSELCEIAQACDCRTSVGLARTADSDLRCFLSPPPIPDYIMKYSLQECLRMVLSRLPETGAKSCITRSALQAKVQYFDDHHALLSHTALPEHRHLLVEQCALLPLLQRVVQEHSHDVALHSLVAQMLANLALDPALHEPIFRAGWVGILARWLRSSQVLLSFPAGRALANMDTDSLWPTAYRDGVYLLHPQYRDREPSADVILCMAFWGVCSKLGGSMTAAKGANPPGSQQCRPFEAVPARSTMPSPPGQCPSTPCAGQRAG